MWGVGVVGCRAENTERGDIVLAWRRTDGEEKLGIVIHFQVGVGCGGVARAFLWGR